MRKELENAKMQFKASLKNRGSFDNERHEIIGCILKHTPNWNLKLSLFKY